MVTIREQLQAVRQENARLEQALGTGALAKKAVVAQSIADQLWTDPISGEVYKRYPITINQFTTGIVLRDASAGSDVRIFEYGLSDGVELQFVPNFGPHYISGRLSTTAGSSSYVNDYPCSLEGWDAFFREFRGTIWDGTTTDINDSDEMRENGHPLTYNGDKEVRLIGGDNLIFRVNTPTGGTAIDITPATSGVSSLAFRCYQLTKIRQG